MNNENENVEINLDELDEINGGLSVKAQTTDNSAKPRCKKCNKKMLYLGQGRVNGGNTGKYKCTNKNCKEYNVVKYNDEVKW